MRTPARILAALCSASILAVLPSCGFLPVEEDPPVPPLIRAYEKTEYKFAAVSFGDVINSLRITCQYTPAKQQSLAFGVSGALIAGVYVAQGDFVEEGDLLAELDRSVILAQIDSYTYNISQLTMSRKHFIETHLLELERLNITLKGLQKRLKGDPENANVSVQITSTNSSISATKTSYTAQLDIMNERISAANFKLSELKEQAAARQIYAPFDGTVTFIRTTEPGGLSTEGENFVTISDKSTSVFTVSGDKAIHFEVGDVVDITISSSIYSATAISPDEFGIAGKPDTVYLKLDEYLPDLKDNATGSVTLVIDSRMGVLTLPSAAVKSANGKNIIYYLNEDGIRTMKFIESGFSAGGITEIISGLSEGELVIVE